MSFGSFQRGFFLSGFVFVAGAVLASSFYLKLLESENPSGPLERIPYGQQSFVLESFGKCFGAIDMNVQGGSEPELLANGWLTASYQGKKVVIDLELNSAFNSLGQLVGFYAISRFGHDQIVVGLREVHPIKFELSARVHGRKIHWKHSIPGPIMIKDNRDGTARISYFLLRKLSYRQSSFDDQPVLRKLGVTLVPGESACKKETAVPLVLDPLAMDIIGVLQDAQTFMQEYRL